MHNTHTQRRGERAKGRQRDRDGETERQHGISAVNCSYLCKYLMLPPKQINSIMRGHVQQGEEGA